MNNQNTCPSCREPLNAPAGDGCALLTRHKGEQVFITPEPFYDWSVTIASHTFVTLKGHEPNAFHRWMQEKLLGFKWRRNDG